MRDGEPNQTPKTATSLPLGANAGWWLARLRARLAPPAIAVAFALLVSAVGLMLRWAIDDPEPRFIVLYPTVAVAALLAGPIAGLATTVVVAIAADLLYLEPFGSLVIGALDDVVAFVNFVLTGLIVSLIAALDQILARRTIAADRHRREAEAQHRALVDQLHEGVLLIDRRGTVVSANPSAERMLGRRLADLRDVMHDPDGWSLVREDGSRLPPDDYPVPRVFRSGTAVRGALAGLTLGEETRWFLYNATPSFDPDGTHIGAVILSFTDVTERRRAQREAAAGRLRLRSLFAVLNEGVILFGRNGEVLAHNPSAERILGHPPGTLDHYPPGYVGWNLTHADGSAMTLDEYPVVRALRGGQPIHDEVIGAPRADGIAWLLNNADPMIDPETGEVEAVVVSFADISERLRREAELAESRAHLASVLEALHEAVLVFGPDGRTLSANRAAATVLRRPHAELLAGEGFLGLGRPTFRADGTPFPPEERPIRRALSSGIGRRDTIVGILDPSGLFWLQVNDQPIIDPRTGRLRAVVASFTDITERLRQEAVLAESRAHLASVFAAVHEGILVFSVDGAITSWNPAAERLLRLTGDRLRTADIFTAPGGLREDGSPMPIDEYPAVRTLRGGEAVHNVVLGLAFPEGRVWLLVNSEPIRDPETGAVRAAVVSLVDVTERLQARRQLEESRSRFASIVASAMDAIVCIDEAERIVLFNAAAERMFGLPAADAVGRPLHDLVPEHRRADHDAAFARYRDDGPGTRRLGIGLPLAALRSDGTEFPVEGSISRVEIDGRPLFTLVLRDISERLVAERTDAHLATVVRSSPDAILTVSMEGRIETWNDAATRMFGYRPEEAIGTPIGLLSYPDRPDGGTSIDLRVREGEAVKLEAVRRRADGTPIEVMSSSAPLRDAAGNVVAGVVILSDISERKRKERLLAERDEELRQTLDAAGLGVWWLDCATERVHCDGRSRTLFAAAEEEPFASLAERLVDDDRDQFLALPRRLAASPLDHPLVLRRSTADAPPLWLSLTARRRREDDGGEEIWGTVQDVSEAHRAEEAIRRFEATRRLEALGRMTGGIAHDLNNLLTVVSGNLQLLEMSPGDPAAGRWIAEALKASESGAALNDRLLTFARRRRLDPALTDLDDLIAGMVDMLHRSVGPEIAITTVLGAGQARVRIDPAEIENATLNLVLNARDAMPDGGRIVVETTPVVLDATGLPPDDGIEPGPFVRLSVSDTGHGMPPDVQARAFEPFFTTKEIGRGSGLGLSTLHGFVRQSGGFVTLYSEVGRGTVVNVYLPRSDAIDAVTKQTLPPLVRGAGETILLVEDDADVRRVMRERLRALGYRVETAVDPAAARALLETGRAVDLVLTDIVMPGGITGLDFARALRAEDPERRIVVTSGFAEDLAGGTAPLEIEFAFLRKPHSLAELATTVAAALRAPRDTAPRR